MKRHGETTTTDGDHEDVVETRCHILYLNGLGGRGWSQTLNVGNRVHQQLQLAKMHSDYEIFTKVILN